MLADDVILASWSRTQQSVSLSSCEAEYYAIVTGYVEAKFVQSVLEELGREPGNAPVLVALTRRG